MPTTTRTITETTSTNGTVTRVIVEQSPSPSQTSTPEPLKYGASDTPPAGQRRDCFCGNRMCPICG